MRRASPPWPSPTRTRRFRSCCPGAATRRRRRFSSLSAPRARPSPPRRKTSPSWSSMPKFISCVFVLFVSSWLLHAQQPGPAPVIRTDISGEWAVVSNEDQPHRAPGPELGDYTGLPLNDADRQKADAWDASILSQPERQAQAHPAQYWMRGPGPALRILKVLDPVTQEVVAYTIA